MHRVGKRILYVNPVADMVGGAEVSLLNLVKQAGSHGYTPVALLPRHGALAQALADVGCDVHYGPLYPFMIEQDVIGTIVSSARSILSLPSMFRIVSDLHVDLVHVNSYRIGIPLSIIAKSEGIPIVWHVRDIPSSGLKRGLLSHLLSLSDKVVCISQAVRDAVCPRESSNCCVIWNGVDLEPFDASGSRSIRSEWGVSDESCVFCTVGQLVPWKGHDIAIKAFAQLANDHDMRLIIVGTASSIPWERDQTELYYEYLHRLVWELGVAGEVLFLGHRSDVVDIMNGADIYVHSTRRPEPFGRTLIEAMAAEKPVIAPDWGGIPEIVEHGSTGLLYPPNDVDTLAGYMSYAVKNRFLMSKLGTLGKKKAQEQFSIERHAAEVYRLYEDLIS